MPSELETKLSNAEQHAQALSTTLAELSSTVQQVKTAADNVEHPILAGLSTVGLQEPDGFYSHIRGEGELFPKLSAGQLAGLEQLLHSGTGVLPLRWMAYVLATVYHETNRTMQSVKEAYWCSESWRKKNLRYYPYYGRCLVQLTWDYNYKKATDRLRELGFDVDLVAHPDDALQPEIAATIAVVGMLEGWFTGKALKDYINNSPKNKQQYVNARRIINGTDKADLIAGYAIEFENGLQLGVWR